MQSKGSQKNFMPKCSQKNFWLHRLLKCVNIFRGSTNVHYRKSIQQKMHIEETGGL